MLSLSSGEEMVRAALLALAVTLCAARVAAADAPRVLFLTQPGPLGEVVAAMTQDLHAQGAETVSFNQIGNFVPSAVVADDESLADAGLRAEVLAYVRGGGALVLLVEPSLRHYSQANLLLGELGAGIQALSGSPGDLVLDDNPVTNGLSLPATPAFRAALIGAGVIPLAHAGQSTVIGQIRTGQGGVIVIPASLLTASTSDHAGLVLTERAVSWANQNLGSAGGPPSPPTEPPPATAGAGYLPPQITTSLPLEDRDFSGAVLYDCLAGDDQWAQINPLVQQLLSAQGLPLKALRVSPTGAPLAAALESRPELVVLGSWRELDEAEVVALYYYVLAGGRVLMLGHAGTADQIRLVYLNEALYSLGLLLSLGRPGGTAQVVESPVLPLNTSVGTLPPGIEVRGPEATPVIAVANHACMAYVACGPGRLLALDAGPLVDNADYRAALQGGVKWLLTKPG